MKEVVTKIRGGVCAAKGFRAGAVFCGIKPTNKDREDMALVASDSPARAAAVFTTNRVKAAPVQLSRKHLRTETTRAVLLNSGNANACTGPEGMTACRATVAAAAKELGCPASNLLVCSTGRIGVSLPLEKMLSAIPALAAALSRKAEGRAARAIMTSDTFPKQAARAVSPGGSRFVVGGMAKGAGMINPDMATMLCVLATDAGVEKDFLQALLRDAVAASFNRITVDGDTSTNDTVILLANGASGVEIRRSDRRRAGLFAQALRECCADLARDIVRDGEGTTKVIEVRVSGAASNPAARRAAEAVANSILVKCAWAGGDPNWGRILDALGYSGTAFDPARVQVCYDDVPLVIDGRPAVDDNRAAVKTAAKKSFVVRIDLGRGRGHYSVLTTDLTERFVKLNLTE